VGAVTGALEPDLLEWVEALPALEAVGGQGGRALSGRGGRGGVVGVSEGVLAAGNAMGGADTGHLGRGGMGVVAGLLAGVLVVDNTLLSKVNCHSQVTVSFVETIRLSRER